MRSVFTLILIVGLAISALAVYVVQNYVGQYRVALAKERENAAPAIHLTEVFVANKNVRFGEELGPNDVKLVQWPSASMPIGVYSKDNPIFKEGDAPRYAVRVIEKGEPIMSTKVTEPGANASITSKLGPGKRAFTIEVDAKSGVSGFLRPSDRVDIYWTGVPPSVGEESPTGTVTRLIETNIDLIAVDQVSELDEAETRIAQTVTVAISPQQVAKLALAQATGTLYLSLISPGEYEVAEVEEVTKLSLFGEQRQAIAKKEVCTIKSRKGAEVVVTEIPCPE